MMEWANSPMFQAIVRISTMIFSGAAGIVGYIAVSWIGDIRDQIKVIDDRTIEITSAATMAKADAAAAAAAIDTMRTESNRRFDLISQDLKAQATKIDSETMEIFKAETRISCLERRTTCP